MSCVVTKRVIDYSSITQCDGDDANLSLSLFVLAGKKKPTNQHIHADLESHRNRNV